MGCDCNDRGLGAMRWCDATMDCHSTLGSHLANWKRIQFTSADNRLASREIGTKIEFSSEHVRHGLRCCLVERLIIFPEI